MDRKSVLFGHWIGPFLSWEHKLSRVLETEACVRDVCGVESWKAKRSEMEVVWWGWGYCPIWTDTKEILMNLIPPSFSLAVVRLNINSRDSNHHVETHTRGMECESSMYTQIVGFKLKMVSDLRDHSWLIYTASECLRETSDTREGE